MHRILVTGANGQLGSEIRELTAGNKSCLWFYTDVAELDITDKSALSGFVRDNQIDVIINCAAYTRVDQAEDERDVAYQINAEAAGNLAMVSVENDAVLFHVSTDYVFDGSNSTPYKEDDSTAPLGVYGRSKLEAEELIRNSGCHFLIFRTSWLYSSFGNNFVKTIGRLTAEKEVLKVVFDQVGSPTYARDLADVMVSVIEKDSFQHRKGIYHFSNEGVCSWYDFALSINEFFGHSCCIVPCHSEEFPAKVTRPHFSVLDKTKIKNDFGINIPHWRDSLKKCVALLAID